MNRKVRRKTNSNLKNSFIVVILVHPCQFTRRLRTTKEKPVNKASSEKKKKKKTAHIPFFNCHTGICTPASSWFLLRQTSVGESNYSQRMEYEKKKKKKKKKTVNIIASSITQLTCKENHLEELS